jgi:hypothetical protein
MSNQSVSVELEESEWEEVLAAVNSKAHLVRNRHYGDFDPIDGFDPDEWGSRLEEIYNKLQDKLETSDSAKGSLPGKETMSDYHEMMEQLKKLEKEARTTGEPVVGVIVVRPPPAAPNIKILKRWLKDDEKGKT